MSQNSRNFEFCKFWKIEILKISKFQNFQNFRISKFSNFQIFVFSKKIDFSKMFVQKYFSILKFLKSIFVKKKYIFFIQFFFRTCLGASSTRSYITKGSRYAKENQTKWNGLLSFSFGLCDFGMMRFLNFRARPPPKSWKNVSRHHHSRYCKNQDFSKSQFVFATNLPSRQAQRFWSPSELYFHCTVHFKRMSKSAIFGILGVVEDDRVMPLCLR